MLEPQQEINARASKNSEQRKNWYSPVADVYYNARPRYPREIVEQSIALAQLSSDQSILELWCGPGNATVAFAELGVSTKCLQEKLEQFGDSIQLSFLSAVHIVRKDS